MLIEFASSSSSCPLAGVVGSAAAGGGATARGVDGDLLVLGVVLASSVRREVAGESGAGSAWNPEDGEGKMEKDRSRCSSTDDALRVIPPPPPRRGDGDCGCARDDRTKMAPTTKLSRTNHAALEPSHAGSGQHHHSAAAIGACLLARLGKLGGSPTRVSLLRCLLSLLCFGWQKALSFQRDKEDGEWQRWRFAGIYRARDRSGFRVEKVDYRLRN
jgi:hypothetical protein